MNLERFLRRAAIQVVGFLAVLSICPSLVHSQDRPRLTGDLPSEISPKKVADVLANAKIFRWNEKVNIYVENFDRQNKRSRDCTVARTGADLEWLQQQTTFQFGFTDNQSVANFLIATSDSEESEARVQKIIDEKVRTTYPLHMFFTPQSRSSTMSLGIFCWVPDVGRTTMPIVRTLPSLFQMIDQ